MNNQNNNNNRNNAQNNNNNKNNAQNNNNNNQKTPTNNQWSNQKNSPDMKNNNKVTATQITEKRIPALGDALFYNSFHMPFAGRRGPCEPLGRRRWPGGFFRIFSIRCCKAFMRSSS